MKLVNSSVINPRVLIIGVAYKPGVGDVRETPVSELRNHLKSLGAEVSWHDPLVPNWEDSIQVELGWECDVAILATMQPGMDLDQVISRGVPVLDCTNTLQAQSGVTNL
jgi:UDP-N-acetyl-D-glucosamine dehydrogenase